MDLNVCAIRCASEKVAEYFWMKAEGAQANCNVQLLSTYLLSRTTVHFDCIPCRFMPRERAHFPRLRNFEVPGYDTKELSWHLLLVVKYWSTKMDHP
jgi:hypothetical protein